MEQYGLIVAYALPVFLGLILAEKAYGIWKGNDYSPMLDSISSMLSGVTNAVKDVLELTFTILSYGFLVDHLALMHMQPSIAMYLIVFILLDFQGFWVHRWAHEINFFWNKHLIHHSSEEFNLACALRQSISSFVQLFTFFLVPAAILGVPQMVMAVIIPIHLFSQFWYHTRHITSMGWLEHIIVTPAHHRVHHAINPEYLDKNYGQIFIFWDKWFGTFQAEMKEIPAVYGITVPVQTFNPIKINFLHLSSLIRDAWHTRSWRDRLTIWFRPTGWRPKDVMERFPVVKIDDIYGFSKYSTHKSPSSHVWACMQTLAMFVFASHFFSNIAAIGVPNVFVYGFYLFLSVYAFAEWLDGSPLALHWEALKCFMACAMIYLFDTWPGTNSMSLYGTYFVIMYHVASWLGTYAMVHQRNLAAS
jgi:alkylglycerol monooxygenase